MKPNHFCILIRNFLVITFPLHDGGQRVYCQNARVNGGNWNGSTRSFNGDNKPTFEKFVPDASICAELDAIKADFLK